MGFSYNVFTGKLDQTDKRVVEQSISTSSTITNIYNGVGFNVPGPYANDADADANGVAVGDLYYISSGNVTVRQV